MVSDDFREYAAEQLERAGPYAITHRAMFGGVGVYADGLFFALMDDDLLYFKSDETNIPDFEARGMGHFHPYDDERTMPYHQVPGDLLEDPAALGSWLEKAVDVARRKKAAKK